LVYVFPIRARAIKVKTEAAAGCLRDMYGAYRRVAHVCMRGRRATKRARDGCGESCPGEGLPSLALASGFLHRRVYKIIHSQTTKKDTLQPAAPKNDGLIRYQTSSEDCASCTVARASRDRSIFSRMSRISTTNATVVARWYRYGQTLNSCDDQSRWTSLLATDLHTTNKPGLQVVMTTPLSFAAVMNFGNSQSAFRPLSLAVCNTSGVILWNPGL
jgi:hypothetical protein